MAVAVAGVISHVFELNPAFQVPGSHSVPSQVSSSYVWIKLRVFTTGRALKLAMSGFRKGI